MEVAQPAARFAAGYSGGAVAYQGVLDPTLAAVADRVVELAGVEPGQRVLDVATGTGAIARRAHERGAAVVGLDVASGMVEVARRASSEAITFVVGDAAKLPFADNSFDAVTCGFGLSHMPDVDAVLSEIRRTLTEGGCFVESSWGSDGSNRAFAAVLRELARSSGDDVHAFGDILDEATWADPAAGSAILAQHGFTVDVLTESVRGRYSDPASALAWTLAWPDYGETAARLEPRARQAFESAALQSVAAEELDWWFAINYFRGR